MSEIFSLYVFSNTFFFVLRYIYVRNFVIPVFLIQLFFKFLLYLFYGKDIPLFYGNLLYWLSAEKFSVFWQKSLFYYLLPFFYGNQSLFSMEKLPLHYGNAPFFLLKSPFILWKNSRIPPVARAPSFVKDI